ncbi:MAG: DUF4430 domain-containing protein [Ruminococcaceae bacterium]|nr:DUF4430 domain-containing protein [Oscillospiraceae bacterium]
MSKKVKSIIAVAVLAVLVIGAVLVWKANAPEGVEGDKTIEVSIVHGDETTKDVTITTDEEFLRGALEQESLISGTEDQFGLFVTTVDGETVDSSLEEWWCFTKNGETLMTGVDSTPIADGESYEITFTTGW